MKATCNMAEGGTRPHKFCSEKKDFVCRYFIHGVCQKGASCSYVHDKSSKMPVDNVCRYYQFGKCSYGKSCRYDHVKRDETQRTVAHHKLTLSTQSPLLPGAVSHTKPSQMVTLRKEGIDHSIKEAEIQRQKNERWAQAKVFVPGQKYIVSGVHSSYAVMAGANSGTSTSHPANTYHEPGRWDSGGEVVGDTCWDDSSSSWQRSGLGGLPLAAMTENTPLCSYYEQGECPLDDECSNAHGDICDMCGMPRLHPLNSDLRKKHIKECLAEIERDMEESFAYQASQEKECGICLESVLEKEPHPDRYVDRRFGILENCNHSFCLACIRQWRGNEEVSTEALRSCPTCRTHSDFIIPSKYWCETKEEKDKLIKDYKEALKSKPCQFFKEGEGRCPFNEKCFYLHALPNGQVVKQNLVQRRCIINDVGLDDVAEVLLWDYIDGRRGHERDHDAAPGGVVNQRELTDSDDILWEQYTSNRNVSPNSDEHSDHSNH